MAFRRERRQEQPAFPVQVIASSCHRGNTSCLPPSRRSSADSRLVGSWTRIRGTAFRYSRESRLSVSSALVIPIAAEAIGQTIPYSLVLTRPAREPPEYVASTDRQPKTP